MMTISEQFQQEDSIEGFIQTIKKNINKENELLTQKHENFKNELREVQNTQNEIFALTKQIKRRQEKMKQSQAWVE